MYCSEWDHECMFHLPSITHILVVYLGLFCCYVGLAYNGQFSVAELSMLLFLWFSLVAETFNQLYFFIFWSVSALNFLFLFLFFVLFQLMWMLVIVNKANSSLQKGLLTFSKISTLGWMLVTVCKTEFTSWKTLITFTCTLICPLTSAITISLKDMACYAFAHEVSLCNEY